MSAVTLETLRANMLKHIDDMTARSGPGVREQWHAFDRQSFDRCKEHHRLTGRSYLPVHEFEQMMKAAEVYFLAASYEDEAEGLRAVMLYKLSDGAIDPREARP